MAVLNVFEQKETVAIMDQLMLKQMTAPDLNQVLVEQQNICSTATLYRRLKELVLASILEKDGKSFKVTIYGRNLFEEFKQTTTKTKISSKDYQLLMSLKEQSLSTNDIVQEVGSPNRAISQLKKLSGKGLLQKRSSRKSSKGRPKNEYELSEEGEEAVEEYENLRKKATKR